MLLCLKEGACALVPAAEDSQERAEDLCLRCWLFSPCDSLTEDSRLGGQVRTGALTGGEFQHSCECRVCVAWLPPLWPWKTVMTMTVTITVHT